MTTVFRAALAAVSFLFLAETTAARPCMPAAGAERVGDGTISYNTVGTGPAVVLVHGLFADKGQWTALACLLADAGYKAIVPDLPGYGDSTGYKIGDYKLETEVELLHAFIGRLGISRLDIAGNSMGGAIASLYAGAYPETIRSLAYLGSPEGIGPWADGLRNAIFSGINPFIPTTPAELDMELGLLFVKPPPIPDAAKPSMVEKYVRDRDRYIRIWNIANLYNDVLLRTRAPYKPTLIVWGEDDKIFDPSGALALQQRFPESQLHMLPKSGHLLHLENAAEAGAIYIQFLKTESTPAQPASRDSGSAGR